MNEKMADLEEELSLAKYAEGLWAKDQTLLRHPEAAPFFSWIEPSSNDDQEVVVDIESDNIDWAS